MIVVKELMPDYDALLQPVYRRIYAGLPDHACRLCHEIAIRRIDPGKLNARCHQLKEQGIIHISANGDIGFALPRFDQSALTE